VGLSDAHAGFLDGFGTLRPRAISICDCDTNLIWGNRAMQTQCGYSCAPRLASFWAEYTGRPPKRADMGALDALEASECIAIMEEVV
jgi:hypothetical protein